MGLVPRSLQPLSSVASVTQPGVCHGKSRKDFRSYAEMRSKPAEGAESRTSPEEPLLGTSQFVQGVDITSLAIESDTRQSCPVVGGRQPCSHPGVFPLI